MLFLFSCIELRLIIGHNLHHSSKALRSRTQYDIVVKPSLIKRMQICKSTSFFSPPQTWWDLSKVFWDTQELKGFSGFCLFCYWVYPLQLSTLLENLQASRKLTDAETYACTSLTSHCQQVLPEFLHITAALILSLSSCLPRGGRLTSLDASFARCFAFWRTSLKTSTSMFFQKNRQNIASLRKKHDVLHDVLGFRNSIQSYDKSLVT